VTAQYELLEDGRVRVTNRCRKPDGSWSEAVGVARRNASDGREAALEVRFAPRWLSLLPFVWGDYRVMALDEGYSHALVGSRDRRFLWILARQPVLSRAVFERLVFEARRQGFDISLLERTVHTT
jgi:apolipoprotein D and lipocalin family protein